MAGSTGRHRRLDPPLLMALDEVTQVCPVDLPVMLADSAGKGVLIDGRRATREPARAAVGQARRRHGVGLTRDQDPARAISDPDTLERRVEALRHRRHG